MGAQRLRHTGGDQRIAGRGIGEKARSKASSRLKNHGRAAYAEAMGVQQAPGAL